MLHKVVLVGCNGLVEDKQIVVYMALLEAEQALVAS